MGLYLDADLQDGYKIIIDADLIGQQSRSLQTGQTTSYHADDDGDLEKGIARSYTILNTGQYGGTSNIVINGKTHALSNECVRDNQTGLMWARYVPDAEIGPATDGKLFWDQWTLASKTDISFDNVTGEIRSAASEFDTGALCAGRKLTITGSASNDGTYTVSSILAGAITTVEGVADEAAGATISVATVDDLIWDMLSQANTNSLGGYTDWRIPNVTELFSITKMVSSAPFVNTTTFPSTPSEHSWTSTTYLAGTTYAECIDFQYFIVRNKTKKTEKYYLRLVRGGPS